MGIQQKEAIAVLVQWLSINGKMLTQNATLIYMKLRPKLCTDPGSAWLNNADL